jgi:putative endonuclease
MGENVAANYLKNKGYRIIERNYRKQRAEIDIIAKKDEMIVFVEVKTRKNSNFGYGFEAVTRHKQEQIIKAAKLFCQEKEIIDTPCRFDVISIEKDGKHYKIDHFENAFML